MSKILCFILIVLSCASNVGASDKVSDIFFNYLNKLEKQKSLYPHDELVKLAENYLIDNQNVTVKEFSRFRIVWAASRIVEKSLEKKHNVDSTYYLKDKKLTSHEEQLFQLTKDINQKFYGRDVELCKKNKTDNSVTLRNNIKDLLGKKLSLEKNSDKYIQLEEEIYSMCKYYPGPFGLISQYRSKEDGLKHKQYVFEVLRDDQVNYDYMYDSSHKIDYSFAKEYIQFLLRTDQYEREGVFSLEDIKFTTEDMLTKHKYIFDFRNYFYNDNYMFNDVVHALISVSSTLSKYQLDELNDGVMGLFCHKPNMEVFSSKDLWIFGVKGHEGFSEKAIINYCSHK